MRKLLALLFAFLLVASPLSAQTQEKSFTLKAGSTQSQSIASGSTGTSSTQYYAVPAAGGGYTYKGPSTKIPAGATPVSPQEFKYAEAAAGNPTLYSTTTPGLYALADGTTLYFNKDGSYTQIDKDGAMKVYSATKSSDGSPTNSLILSLTPAQEKALAAKIGSVPTDPIDVMRGIDGKSEFMDVYNFALAAEMLNRQGLDIRYATRTGTDTYYYKSILGDDIIVKITGYTVTTWEGTVIVGKDGVPRIDGSKPYDMVEYGTTGPTKRVIAGGTGGAYQVYQFGYNAGDAWSYSEGKVTGDNGQGAATTSTLETKGSGTVVLVEGKRGYSCDANTCVLVDTGTVVNSKTGVLLTSDELGKLSDQAKKNIDAAQKAATAEKTTPSRWEAAWRGSQGGLFGVVGQFAALIQEFFRGYENWKGIGAYGSLFIGKKRLAERRERINEAFCKAGLGIDCKVAKICERYSDKHSGGSTIVTVVPGQSVKAAAHLEGMRYAPTRFQNASGSYTQYLYYITYYASSPESANHVQLHFTYSGGTYDWYPAPGKDIPKGGAASAQGAAALIKYSNRKYTDVCLVYESSIDTGTGHEGTLCVPIQENTVVPDDLPHAPAGGGNADTEEPASPTAPTHDPGAGF
ncbi:MAG TPA: hypothetical protein VLJ21_01180 [Candidatus Binatia bacterium]|nr:hypothetical protein [Candidatus Binatia bacterium]